MLTAKEIKKLREIRRLATFESANFSKLMSEPEHGSFPKSEAEVTDFIRERTRIFRETWILSALDELLASSPMGA